MKRRILSILLVLIMVLGLCACGGGDKVEVVETTEVIEGESGGETSSSENKGSDVKDDSSDNNSGNSGGSTAVSKPADKPSNAATGTDGKAVALANPVYVASGTKAMDEGLNFGGQTFTMATTNETQYQDPQFQRMIAAFQKKYNCKIKTVQLTFDGYFTQVAQAKSAGTPYDIVFMHGSMFPNGATSDLVQDLTPYLTTADYDTGKGGIDIAKSSNFVIGKGLYGVCNTSNVFPRVIYYNKVLFQKAGLEDPLELYNSNKWTWSKFIEMGKKVTDEANGIYFGDTLFQSRDIVHSYGVPMLGWKNGKVVVNVDNANVQKGMKLMQSLQNTYKICEVKHFNGARFESFLAGKAYCTTEESSKFSEIAQQINTASAFNYEISNIGIVPLPQDTASAKRGYPTGWLTATCAGVGSKDPRVAVAWAKFQSTYEDVANDKYELNQTQQALIDKLVSGPIVHMHGAFATTGDSTFNLSDDILSDVTRGKDITQTIETYKQQIINTAKEAGYY